MALGRARSTSPAPQATKRVKTTHESSAATIDPAPHFASGLLDESNVTRLHEAYEQSEPYKHTVIGKLFQDELLKNVKDECLQQLSFTMKETDIYKVRSSSADLRQLYTDRPS